MPEAWIKTTSVNLAAAVATLGIPIKSDQTTDIRSGTQWKTLLLGLESLPRTEIGLIAGEDDTPPAPVVRTKQILELVRSGKLEQADPAHPALDALRALHNRERLLDWMHKGTRYRVAKSSRAPRSQLVAGEEPESVKSFPKLFKTGDLKIVASLAVFGVPVARIEGGGGGHQFYMANTGHDLGVPPMDAHATVTAYRSGAMPEDHPFRWSMQALINREAILDFMFRQRKMVLIRKPGCGLGAIVAENCTDTCMDKVRAHFRIT